MEISINNRVAIRYKMSWFFDKDDEFVISLSEFCKTLQEDKPSNNNNMSPWNKGKTLTEEHKRLIGLANSVSKKGSIPWNKGKKVDTTNFRKTRCDIMHPNGNIEHVIDMKAFCLKHGLSRSNMSMVAQGKQGNHKGYKLIK